MKRFAIIFTLLSIVSCNVNTSDNYADKIISDKEKNYMGFSVIDTLNKYAASDSMFNYNFRRLYIGKANSTEFAFFTLTDTSFQVYQKLDNIWTITDTLNHFLYSVFKPIDLNGDDFKDVIISYNYTAAGGNSENICMIYNSKTKRLVHNEYFDLPNIKYDKETNLVLSAWWSGVVHCQSKMSYKITGDSLVFDMGVNYCPYDQEENLPATVEFYRYKNNKKIIIKIVNGNSEYLWDVFHNAIWNSKSEF